MKENEVSLDGINSGIIALDKTNTIIKTGKYNNFFLFKNIQLLEAVMERESKDFSNLGLYINRDIIPMENVFQIEDYYKFFVNDNEVTYVYPENKEKIIMCGYFNFGDSPCERTTDIEEGKLFSKKIYKSMLENICYQQRKGLLKPDHNIYGHGFNMYGKIQTKGTYGNTLVFRVMKPYTLLQINNFRKNCEFRVLPFNKMNDNYKNLYFCFSRDINEFPGDKKYYESANNILDELISYFYNKYPELNVGYETIMFGRPFDL